MITNKDLALYLDTFIMLHISVVIKHRVYVITHTLHTHPCTEIHHDAVCHY